MRWFHVDWSHLVDLLRVTWSCTSLWACLTCPGTCWCLYFVLNVLLSLLCCLFLSPHVLPASCLCPLCPPFFTCPPPVLHLCITPPHPVVLSLWGRTVSLGRSCPPWEEAKASASESAGVRSCVPVWGLVHTETPPGPEFSFLDLVHSSWASLSEQVLRRRSHETFSSCLLKKNGVFL